MTKAPTNAEGEGALPAGPPLRSVGERLRSLRLERGVSAAALAREAGVTRSFLSQVERSLSNPSIPTLRRIALALGVPVFYLLDDGVKPHRVVRKGERKVLRSPHSQVEYELLSPDLQGSLEMIIMEVQPGKTSTNVPMSHVGEECALVLQGKIRVQVGDEVYDLEEGDTIYFTSTVPHRVINLGTKTARVISAITPPNF